MTALLGNWYLWFINGGHGLSQQGVWASFGHPNPWKAPLRTHRLFCEEFSWNDNLRHIIEFFQLHIIPMILYKDIMPYFDKCIHFYGWNLSILWSTLKIWTAKKFTIASFGHPVSKSWLRPWIVGDIYLLNQSINPSVIASHGEGSHTGNFQLQLTKANYHQSTPDPTN